MQSTEEEKERLLESLKESLERKRQREQEADLIEMAFNRIRRIKLIGHPILDGGK